MKNNDPIVVAFSASVVFLGAVIIGYSVLEAVKREKESKAR